MNITDLQEIFPNVWKAKYHGNYGIYTIKIKREGEKIVEFSCSCPSSGYPCKHIPMVEEAIRERIAKSQKSDVKNEISLEQLLKDAPQKMLCDFIIRQTQFNPQFKNTVLLEFAPQLKGDETSTGNHYNQLLHNALADVYFDEEDIEHGYYDGSLTIDVLDQWLEKAQTYVNQNNPQEAILICKACIEEYAAWYEEQDAEIAEFVVASYGKTPFGILLQTLSMAGTNVNELLSYCKSEMSKSVYTEVGMSSGFNNLFMKLSAMTGSTDYIELQDRLLKAVDDKNSNAAYLILQRKIDFYRSSNQPDKADDVIKENLQINLYREEWAKKLIAIGKSQEAKDLIFNFLTQRENANEYRRPWFELLLQAAQKENDMLTMRSISLQFIDSVFKEEYYQIYKSTFTEKEWAGKVEKLIKHYEKNLKTNCFSVSVANILIAEKQEERLMNYIGKHLSMDIIEKYYTYFSTSFPEQTLALFRKVIDRLAQNTGRNVYEQIATAFEKMKNVEGGDKLVKEMIIQYKSLYKNRKAMIETLNRVKV